MRILAVGKARPAWVRDAAETYLQRLRHYTRLELVEIKAATTGSRGRGSSRAIAEEGRRMEAALEEHERLFALDERGAQHDTASFAEQLQRWLLDGRSLAFAIGGAYGLDGEVLRHAEGTLALSRLTLPHQLARVVLLEQLYRAFTVLRGEPYHNP